MATQTCYDQRSFNSLSHAWTAFANGNKEEGFKQFQSAVIPDQHKVYRQLWINRNEPRGNHCYGEQAFNDIKGLKSTLEEKARAIEPMIGQIYDIREREKNFNPYVKYETRWNHSTGHYERVVVYDDKKTGRWLDDICPKPGDPNNDAKVVAIVGSSFITCLILVFTKYMTGGR